MGVASPLPPRISRFGAFTVDLRLGELRKNGLKIRLQEQPLRVLAMLLERPGELVTREELRQRLWAEDTFVDFDHGLNAAINRLRDRLSDNAEKPRYIATIPRRGYRFIAAVETEPAAPPAEPETPAVPPAILPPVTGLRRTPMRWGAVALAGLVVLAAAFFGLVRRGRRGAPPTIRTIAVLPLQNLSGDPGQEYFSDGLTDSLITDLAKVSSLRVISRTSTMRYKNSGKNTAQIARELKVDAVVEGSVVRAGDRVRVTAQLIDAETDQHLWAESYDRDLRDIIALEGDVAESIARQVRATLTPQDRTRLAARQSTNLQAYDYTLQGRYHYQKWWPSEEWNTAISYFQKAVQSDPGYAPAHVGLADSYLHLGHFALSPPLEVMPRGKAEAELAVKLDPDLAEAHFSLAFAAMYYDWDWALAEKEFQRGFELNPGYSSGHAWYSYFLLFRGRLDEGLAEQTRALELDPLFLPGQLALGQKLYYSRRYDQAIAQLRKTIEMDPQLPVPHHALANVYKHKGMYKEAVAEYETAWRLNGTTERATGFRRAFVASGFPGAQRWLRDYLARTEGKDEAAPLLPGIRLAIAYGETGDKNAAFRLLEKAYQERQPYLVYLKVDPDFDALRPDPRFDHLARRIGLP